MATFNAIDYTEAAGRLASGAFVRVPVSGSGMRPFLRPGEDSVLLAPVKLSGHNYSQWELNAFQSRCGNPDRRYRNRSCASGRITIRRRDVVLVRHKDGMTPVLMRVVHVWGTLLLLREDSSYSMEIRVQGLDRLIQTPAMGRQDQEISHKIRHIHAGRPDRSGDSLLRGQRKP